MAGHDELTDEDYEVLGDFRFQMRRFLRFSEEVARAEGLEPQQHQALLAIRSHRGPEGPTMGWLADHLLIKQHSAVGLIDRLEERHLAKRTRGGEDRRQVRIQLTAEGERKLKRLSIAHRAELREHGAGLVETLRGIVEQLSGTTATR